MTNHPNVLAFGDSLTAGYGLASIDSFPAQLERLLRTTRPAAHVINAGVSGDTSASGRARLPRVLSRLTVRPDLAIVELGANDLLRGLAPARMRENLDAILRALADCGIPVLLAGMQAPPFLGSFARGYDAVFTDLAAAHGVPLYPFFLAGVVGDPALVLADGIHPNARAIGIVAQAILPHVEAALIAGERAKAA
ncbi:arylesterase [Sphingomonas sp.]|jgi:acyl-CoA thioesterase-1|uniref:arylesterase n=1 Tax=Sphingomonas sp. TaxID=28214 RepID=UPI002ED7C393